MKRLAAGAGLLVALVLGAVACLPSGEAWQALDTGFEAGQTGWTPTAPQNPSANSHVVDNHTVDLIWRPGQPNSYGGTSAETDNLDIDVQPGDVIGVDYGLSSSTADAATAMPAADAIRLFGYLNTISRPGNRPSSAPTYQVAAQPGCAHACHMEFTVDQRGTLGYSGLVYDVSNGGVQGRVRFSNLSLNGELILFN